MKIAAVEEKVTLSVLYSVKAKILEYFFTYKEDFKKYIYKDQNSKIQGILQLSHHKKLLQTHRRAEKCKSK